MHDLVDDDVGVGDGGLVPTGARPPDELAPRRSRSDLAAVEIGVTHDLAPRPAGSSKETPEPASLVTALVGGGLGLLGWARRRRKQPPKEETEEA